MSYIGQGLPADVFSGYVTDTFTGDGSSTTFTLSKAPFSADSLIVVVDNVIQQPTTNFTVSGTTLTIVGTAILSGIKGYAIHTGGAIPITQASGLTSSILTSQTDIGGALADADLFLVDDGAGGTLRKVAASRLKTYIDATNLDGAVVINESSADVDFRVESNGNANMLVVDGGDDDVRIGTATSFGPLDAGLKVKGDITIGDFTNDSAAATLGFIKSRNTTVGSQTIVADDDEIGRIAFRADDGNDANYNNNVAAIFCQIDSAPGTDDTGGRLQFSTTADGARTVTEHMRIDRNGKVLIGTTSDATSSNLQVITAQHNARNAYFTHSGDPASAAPYGIGINYSNGAPDNDSNTANMFIYCSDTSAGRFVVAGDGDVLNHDNSYGQISDQRLKTNIADANSQWDDIKALKVRNFEKKDDIELHGAGKRVQIGVIAQELEAAGMNGLVKTGEPSELDIKHSSDFGTLYEDGDTIPDGKKIGDIKTTTGEKVRSVKYSVLYMKAIKALQEAMAKIETLETKVKALEDA